MRGIVTGLGVIIAVLVGSMLGPSAADAQKKTLVVALNQDHTLRRIFDDACARHGVTPTIAFEGTDITTLRGLIGARLGVAILPPASTPSPNIIEIALDDDHLVRQIAIGWMANRFLPPSAASFRDSALAWRRTRDAPHDTAQPAQRRRGSSARRKQR